MRDGHPDGRFYSGTITGLFQDESVNVTFDFHADGNKWTGNPYTLRLLGGVVRRSAIFINMNASSIAISTHEFDL